MIRVFLAVIFMFFLPYFAYAAYVFIRSKGQQTKNLLAGAPMNWLALAGTILALGTLARLVSDDILKYENAQTPAIEQQDKQPAKSKP